VNLDANDTVQQPNQVSRFQDSPLRLDYGDESSNFIPSEEQ